MLTAVNAAAFGAFMHQGQICMSTEHIVVDERITDQLAKKLATKANALPAGDPRGGNVVLGSVVDKTAVDRIQGLVADAVKKGAKLIAGGEVDGTIMKATVLDRVTPDMRIYSEESFGPVVTIVRVKNTEEAVRIANDTEYGLSAAVFGRDIGRAINVAKRIESGICHVNGPTVHDEAQMPFGGTKASGALRRQGRDRQVHRATVDYGADGAEAFSALAVARHTAAQCAFVRRRTRAEIVHWPSRSLSKISTHMSDTKRIIKPGSWALRREVCVLDQ